ncbi:MAG: FixH family protein [Bacteroidetes bacterium]|nr:FixH family protein [Bacteroidota bacterium]
MNWGTKITIVYIGFVVLIVSMVFISSKHKSDLVAKDYYAQELKYQEKIDAIDNEKNLQTSIDYKIENDSLILSFPLENISSDFSGELLFFRPSDASKDLKINLSFDKNGEQKISKALLSKGIYKICISWNNNNKTYYKEQVITI